MLLSNALLDTRLLQLAMMCSDMFREQQAVAAVAGVTAMPTFQVWHKGTKVDELVGASKEKLKAMIEKHSS